MCTAAAPSAVEAKPRPGEKKGGLPKDLYLWKTVGGLDLFCMLSQAWMRAGFVEEMRFVAMKLHTRDQAPKEGQKEAAEKAWKEVPDSHASVIIPACCSRYRSIV